MILWTVLVALAVPATTLAQRRRTSRRPTSRTTQTTAPAQPTAAQPRPSATPAQPPPTPAASPRVEAQAAGSALPAKAKATRGTWRLRVSTAQPRTISLKSDRALVSEIASELGRKLNVPVKLSPVMEKARVTLDFSGTPLEGALLMIAPQPFVDYELSGDSGFTTKPVAVYLYALNESPPAETEVVRGDTEAILIEGNTEEVTDGESEKDKREKVLNVKVERNQVTLHARRQPLTAVLYEIASKVDIPFEMKYDSSEIVDVDLNNVSMEQVVRSLSPNIRLYQRTDLQTYETRPLRIVLAPPSTQQTTKM